MNPIAAARNWSFALGGGAMVLAAFGLTLRLPVQIGTGELQVPPGRVDQPGLRTSWNGAQSEAALIQAAQLMDPTPLFMPTPLSVTSKRLVGRGIIDRFPALTPKEAMKFQPGDLQFSQLPPPVAIPASPADALGSHAPGILAMGFGRTDQAPVPLTERQAWVEITVPATGEVALRSPLPAGAVADLPGSNWEAVHFTATVNAAGLIGSVIPMPSPPAQGGFLSLDAETAQELANYLETRMMIGQRLAPGFYRISIGP